MVGRHLRDDLRGDIAGRGKTVRTFDQRAGDNGTVLQHVLQVDQIAVVHVLGIVIRIMEMNDALVVCIHDVLGQQNAVGDIPGYLAGHIVALGGVDHGVFIGVFLLGFLVVAFDQAQNLIVRRVGLAYQRAGIPIGDIGFGHLKGAVRHDLLFHHILYFFHAGGTSQLFTGQYNAFGDALNLHGRHAFFFAHRLIGLADGDDDLFNVEGHFRAVAFDDFHFAILSVFPRPTPQFNLYIVSFAQA